MDGRDAAFEQAMDQAEDVDFLKAVLNEFSKSIGFDYFGFGMQVWLPSEKPQQLFWTNYPLAWQEEYDTQDYVKIDPVVSYSLGNTLPAFWSEIEAMTGARKVLRKARQAGMNVGLTVPLNLPRDNFGVLSFARESEFRVSSETALRLKQRALWFGHAFASRAIELVRPVEDPIERKLSSREREVLKCASKGMTIQEISQELGVSGTTVRYFITQAGKKLGVTGKNAIVAKAVAIGLLDVREVELRTSHKFRLKSDS